MKKKGKFKTKAPANLELRESPVAFVAKPEPMIRTQIYLNKAEHEFLQAEARRRDHPMAAVIRSFIDERMQIPEHAWTDNPLLRLPVEDPTWKGREDGAVNHDHYIYGTPKKWMKRNGKWVETPSLPDDYYSNPASRRAFDEMVDQWT